MPELKLDLPPPFDPKRLGFVHLETYWPVGTRPGWVRIYEYGNHPCVDGAACWLRQNTYMSASGSRVFVWEGFLDDMALEAMFNANNQGPIDEAKEQRIFRGNIEDDEQAAHIFRAFRLDGSAPFILRPGKRGYFEFREPDGSDEEKMRSSILQAFNWFTGRSDREPEAVWNKARKFFKEQGHAIELDRGIFDRELNRLIQREAEPPDQKTGKRVSHRLDDMPSEFWAAFHKRRAEERASGQAAEDGENRILHPGDPGYPGDDA